MKDLVQLTNKNLTKIWNNQFTGINVTQEQFKYHFGLRLFQYAAGKHFDLFLPRDKRKEITSIYRQLKGRNSSKEKQFQRLLLGYNGIPVFFSAFRSGISSKSANLNKKNTTQDHVIGVTLAGQTIAKELDKRVNNKYDNLDNVQKTIDEMCNEWLPNNLWLWATCRITREEHKSNRLYRGDEVPKEYINSHSPIEYKKKLIHYKEAKIIIEEYK